MVSGWKLDAGDGSQRFSLASYPLKKGATVRIHTGRGTTRAADPARLHPPLGG